MRIFTTDNICLQYSVHSYLPWLHDTFHGPVIAYCMMVGFSLGQKSSSPLESLLTSEEVWRAIDHGVPEGDVFDEGLPKPCSEFLLHGSCHSPHPVKALECGVQVGALVKRLAVFGDRFIQGGHVSEPRPFRSMPLSWANAYGGPGHAYNHAGKGHIDADADADGLQLPNIEDRERPSPETYDQRQPAGLAPLPARWPRRAGLLGAFDKTWLTSVCPGLPNGTRPEFACLGHHDQRFPGYLQGGEPIVLQGLHPDAPILRAEVPRLRGRMFILRDHSREEQPREIPCVMETLWLFPEIPLGILLFRGVTTVADEECEDIAAFLAAVEDSAEPPAPDKTYVDQFFTDQRNSHHPQSAPQPPEHSSDAALATHESGPAAGSDAVVTTVEGLAATAAVSATGLEALGRLVASIEEETRQRLQEMGASALDTPRFRADSASVSPDALPTEVLAGRSPEDISDHLQSAVLRLQAETEARLVGLGLDPEQFIGPSAETMAPSPNSDPLDALRSLAAQPGIPSELSEELKTALGGFSRIESLLVATIAARSQSAEEARAPLHVEVASGDPLAASPPAPGTVLTTDQALALARTRNDLSFCDLSACDLSGRDLSGVDLRGALLSGVIWKGINLCGADLREAVADGAVLTGSNLDDALLDGIVLDNANLVRCSARKCSARSAQFSSADLSECDFRLADLSGADCVGACLRAANCAGVKAPGIRLQGANIGEARFDDADLSDSRADRLTEAQGAVFSRATCRNVCWGGATLRGACFEEAILDGADLAKADLREASLVLAQAREVNLDKALLHHADLRGCNLFLASLRRANLRDAVIEDANLFGADIVKCELRAETSRNVNLQRTALDPAIMEERHV